MTSDGPSTSGQSTLVERLDGPNYMTWRFKMVTFLRTKGLWSAIEGNPPEDETARAAWDKRDLEALNAIVQTLSSAQTAYVVNQISARGVWMKLEDVNRGRLLDRKLNLRRKVNAVKWERGDNANQYMHRVESLAEELRTLGDVLEDVEVASIALQGLPPAYHSVARSFDACSMVDITPGRVKYALLQEEGRQNTLTENVAYKARTFSWKGQDGSHGSPLKCFQCGKIGHKARECHSRKENRRFTDSSTRKGRQPESRFNKSRQGARLARTSSEEHNGEEEQFFAFEANTAERVPDDCAWSIDSGASNHMTGRKDLFSNFSEEPQRNVTLADGNCMQACGKGTVVFRVQKGNLRNMLTANDVLYVPGMADNLISVSKLTDSGIIVTFSGNDCTAYKGNKLVFSALKEAGIYRLQADTVPGTLRAQAAKENENNCDLWHRRLGHLNYDSLIRMSHGQIVSGIPRLQRQEKHQCEDCLTAKQPRRPFKPRDEKPRETVLDLLHIDLCGPFPVRSIGGSRYALVIVDDCSRRASVHFLDRKDEAGQKIANFIRQAEVQTGCHVKRIRTDNGGEFLGAQLERFLADRGIIHEKTVPYSPAQNGVAERTNRTLVETARTMLTDSKLPEEFWAEAMHTAAYVRNRCSKKIINQKVPEELYTKRHQSVKYFKTFGCLAYLFIPAGQRTKLDQRSKPAIFLGYCTDRKGYRFYDPQTDRITVSRDVTFLETKRGAMLLPGHSITEGGMNEPQHISLPKMVDIGECRVTETGETLFTEDREASLQSVSEDNSAPSNTTDSTNGSEAGSEDKGDSQPEQEDMVQQQEVRRTTRVSRPPDRLQLDPRKKSYCDKAEIELTEPNTYQEAMKSPEKTEWEKAMNDELQSHREMNTWDFVPREPSMKIVKSKWVYRIKRGPTGKIDKFKARVVAVGCSQVYGLDYYETFSPVIKLTSLRTLLALGNEEGMAMKQLDVKTAYLHGVLEEEVYMEPPPGSGSAPTQVCKLNKSIYGLKQAGRTWYKTLDSILKSQGYRRLEADNCVYIKTGKGYKVVLGVYVDDILLLATTKRILDNAVKNLGDKIALKDLGEPKYILGIEIERDKGKKQLSISQKKYIGDILKKYHMEDCKPVGTPMEAIPTNDDVERPGTEDPNLAVVPYQNLIGNLMYLVQGTRPDIAFATHFLGQYNSCFTSVHWKMAKRVLRYLQGTRNTGITYTACGEPVIGHSDASWNEAGKGQSRSAFVFTLSQGAISWKSTKQQVVALSTCEAEYVAITETIKEGKWLQTFFQELEFENYGTAQLEIRSDNQSAIRLMENPVQHQRSKHISLKHLFARHEVEDGRFHITYLPTEKMIADSLTKPVNSTKNITCATGCGMKLH